MKIEYDEISNPGGRPINEDAYVIVRSENMIAFAVADGLGGHGNLFHSGICGGRYIQKVQRRIAENKSDDCF